LYTSRSGRDWRGFVNARTVTEAPAADALGWAKTPKNAAALRAGDNDNCHAGLYPPVTLFF
jgi:hypothetical protein